MQDPSRIQNWRSYLTNPFLLRMAGFQALIDGWFSAPADSVKKFKDLAEAMTATATDDIPF
jgi:hypothetical protein